MKLSTMLLPTGEFIFVFSEVGNTDIGSDWSKFREQTGATGVVMHTGPVEIENALFDQNARRADKPATTEIDNSGDIFTKTFFPRLQDRDGREFSMEFTASSPAMFDYLGMDRPHSGDEAVSFGRLTGETISAGDDLLAAALDDGADFSPAGLVVGGTHGEAELEPELKEALSHDRLREAALFDHEAVRADLEAVGNDNVIGRRVEIRKLLDNESGAFDDLVGLKGVITYDDRKDDGSVRVALDGPVNGSIAAWATEWRYI